MKTAYAVLFFALLASGCYARTLQQSVEGQSEDGRQQGGATANQDGGAAQAQAVGTRSARASTAVVSNSAGETVAAFEASGDNSEGELSGVGGAIAVLPTPEVPSQTTGQTVLQTRSIVLDSAIVNVGGSTRNIPRNVPTVSAGGARPEMEQMDDETDMEEGSMATNEPAQMMDMPQVMQASPAVEASPAMEATPAVEASPAMQASPAVEASPAMQAPPAMEASPAMPQPEPMSPSPAMSQPAMMSPSPSPMPAPRRTVTIDGVEFPEICLLNSDASNFKTLVSQGYLVTVITPIRGGFRVSRTMARGRATRQSSFITSQLSDDLRALCSEQLPSEVVAPTTPTIGSQQVRQICASGLIHFFPNFQKLCQQYSSPSPFMYKRHD